MMNEKVTEKSSVFKINIAMSTFATDQEAAELKSVYFSGNPDTHITHETVEGHVKTASTLSKYDLSYLIEIQKIDGKTIIRLKNEDNKIINLFEKETEETSYSNLKKSLEDLMVYIGILVKYPELEESEFENKFNTFTPAQLEELNISELSKALYSAIQDKKALIEIGENKYEVLNTIKNVCFNFFIEDENIKQNTSEFKEEFISSNTTIRKNGVIPQELKVLSIENINGSLKISFLTTYLVYGEEMAQEITIIIQPISEASAPVTNPQS